MGSIIPLAGIRVAPVVEPRLRDSRRDPQERSMVSEVELARAARAWPFVEARKLVERADRRCHGRPSSGKAAAPASPPFRRPPVGAHDAGR